MVNVFWRLNPQFEVDGGRICCNGISQIFDAKTSEPVGLFECFSYMLYL